MHTCVHVCSIVTVIHPIYVQYAAYCFRLLLISYNGTKLIFYLTGLEAPGQTATVFDSLAKTSIASLLLRPPLAVHQVVYAYM